MDSQISRLVELYSLGDISKAEISAKIAQISDLRNKLDKELIEIDLPRLSVKNASKIIQSFDDVLAQGDFNQIRLLLTELIDRIEIDGEDVEIHWRFC